MGCGSGEWVMQVADQFPATSVYGIDISPIQETDDVPLNVEFFVADINDGLDILEDASADLVASRYVSLCPSAAPAKSGLDCCMRVSRSSNGPTISRRSSESWHQ